MKTEDILNLDCRKPENKKTIEKYLLKVKPVKKLYDKEGELTIELLEKAMHGIILHYDFSIAVQGIRPHYDGEKFIYYVVDVLRDAKGERTWCGCVYGVTMWEVVAKIIIKIYGEIMKERGTNNGRK